jgi:hypothetical protein
VTTTMNWHELAQELRRHFPAAQVEVEGGGAASPYISVTFENGDNTRRTYLAGDANKTWMADYYPSETDIEEGLSPEGSVDTHVSVVHTDPWMVGLNLAAAIARLEVE